MNYQVYLNRNEFTNNLFNNKFKLAKELFDEKTILNVETLSLNGPQRPINEMLLYACSHENLDVVIWLFEMLEKVDIKDQYNHCVYQNEFEYDYEEFFMNSIKMVNLQVSKYIYSNYIDDEISIEIIVKFINKYLSDDKYTELYIYLLMINDIDKTKLDQIDTTNNWINKQIESIQGLRS
jgi:hypothetical protein